MKILPLFCFAVFFGNLAHAQVTTTETQTLSFGTILADPSGDTITVRTNGTIRAASGSDLQGGHSRAIFHFSGPADTSVSYSFSTNDTLTGNGESVNIGNFVSNLPTPFSLTGAGVKDMLVGADLIIPAGLNGGSFSGGYILTIDNQ